VHINKNNKQSNASTIKTESGSIDTPPKGRVSTLAHTASNDVTEYTRAGVSLFFNPALILILIYVRGKDFQLEIPSPAQTTTSQSGVGYIPSTYYTPAVYIYIYIVDEIFNL